MRSRRDSRATERRKEAEAWCDKFDENNKKWLKTTVATWAGDDVEITYEDVDTTLIPPRPRLYGLVGSDEIEKVWKERQAVKDAASNGKGNGAVSAKTAAAAPTTTAPAATAPAATSGAGRAAEPPGKAAPARPTGRTRPARAGP